MAVKRRFEYQYTQEKRPRASTPEHDIAEGGVEMDSNLSKFKTVFS